MTSRAIESLHPVVADKCRAHIKRCKEVGITLLITCTWRSPEEQDALFAQGRTKPGPIVTWAKAGESIHQWRCAYDVVPLRENGQPLWDTSGEAGKVWEKVGRLGQELGLEWGGAWKGKKDLPHFEFTNGLTLAQLQEGKIP